MAEYLVPDYDVRVSGTWLPSTGAVLDDVVDEGADGSGPNNTDYYYNTTHADGDYVDHTLSNPSGTPGSGDVILKVTWRLASAGKTHSIKLDLYQGDPGGSGSLVATIANTNLPTSWTNDSHTLTSGEKSAITNWNDLYVRLTAVSWTGAGGKMDCQVDYIQLEAPDGAVSKYFDFSVSSASAVSGALKVDRGADLEVSSSSAVSGELAIDRGIASIVSSASAISGELEIDRGVALDVSSASAVALQLSRGLYETDFDLGIEDPLSESGAWQSPSGSSALGDMKVVSGEKAFPSTLSLDCIAWISTTTEDEDGADFDADQWAEATMEIVAGNERWPAIGVRISKDGSGILDGYLLALEPKNSYIHLMKMDAESFWPPKASIAKAIGAGTHRIRLEVKTVGGNAVLKCWYDGGYESGLDYTDSSSPFLSGQPGIQEYVDGSTAFITWFEAADSGAAAQDRYFDFSVSSVSSVGLSLSADRELSALISSASAISGELEVDRGIASLVSSSSAISGELEIDRGVALEVLSASAVALELQVGSEVLLDFSVSSASAIGLDLSVDRTLSALISSASAVSGELEIDRAVELEVLSASAIAAELTIQGQVNFDFAVSGASAVGLAFRAVHARASDPSWGIELSRAGLPQFVLKGEIRYFDFAVSSASAVGLGLGVDRTLSALISSASAISGELEVDRSVDFEASSASAVALELTIQGQVNFDFSVSSASSIGLDLSVDRVLSALISSASAIAGELEVDRGVALEVLSASAVALELQVEGEVLLDFAVSSASAVGLDLELERELSALISSASAIGLDLTIEGELLFDFSVSSVSSIGLDLELERELSLAISGASEIDLELDGGRALSLSVSSQDAIGMVLQWSRGIAFGVSGDSELGFVLARDAGCQFAVSADSAVALALSKEGLFKAGDFEAWNRPPGGREWSRVPGGKTWHRRS